MDEPLDEQYFTWLYSQVADSRTKDPSRTYWKLFRELFRTEFVWIVPNDNNRLEDGTELRKEFLRSIDISPKEVDPRWMDIGCSTLELMVGLSRRLAFEAEGKPPYWFWQLLENIGLGGYNDRRRLNRRRVSDTLENVMFRLYRKDGHGGFFPLRHPRENQRNVELWYQMAAYVLELPE